MPNDLFEHEYDHVFFGFSDILPMINKYEVVNYKYMSLSDIKKQIEINDAQFTEWFKICFDEVYKRNKLITHV